MNGRLEGELCPQGYTHINGRRWVGRTGGIVRGMLVILMSKEKKELCL